MEQLGQRRTVDVDRGLFLVRYLAATDEPWPPFVKVTPEQSSADQLSFVLHPDHDAALLSRPGTCLVVRAMRPGRLEIEVERSHENGSIAATINIEPLTQGDPVVGSERILLAHEAPHNSGELRVLGHVAGLGDIYASADAWLAGPATPARIEGISIEWPGKPHGLEISYSVKTARPLAMSGQLTGIGAFAGTRGKAMPLVGLVFELSGPEAIDYKLTVDTLFLGSPISRVTGRRVIASGPTGREPLVGMRVSLDKIRVEMEQPKLSLENAAARPLSGQVRVFRSYAKKSVG
jgi:hypothetical protein